MDFDDKQKLADYMNSVRDNKENVAASVKDFYNLLINYTISLDERVETLEEDVRELKGDASSKERKG